MRIKRKFVKLTKRTYNHGSEFLLEKHLPEGYKVDEHGNYFISIGDSTTMFTCHLDTASYGRPQVVNHVFDRNFIKTDGTSILGADDKAGMVVLLYMIENQIPGLYYFFLGEEVGCVGSGLLSKKFPSNLSHITKVVSFDRRGTNSVITHQMSGRCCSDKFAEELSNRLNVADRSFKYRSDDTGIYTDSAEFVDLVAECTNISVGYQNEHTHSEVQDIEHLSKLCRACVLVNWESLPIDREPGESDWGYPVGGYGMEDDIYSDNWDADDFTYEESNHAWLDYDGNGSKKMYISKTRINREKELIFEALKIQGYAPSLISWDGTSCWVQEGEEGMEYVGSRNDLIEFIPELSEIPSYYLKNKLPGISQSEEKYVF